LIAFHNKELNRFISMRMKSDGSFFMGLSDPCDADKLPADWTLESFTVIDAGTHPYNRESAYSNVNYPRDNYPRYAFYNSAHNRHIRVNPRETRMGGWTGQYPDVHIAMDTSAPYLSPVSMMLGGLPAGSWDWERFYVMGAKYGDTNEVVINNYVSANAFWRAWPEALELETGERASYSRYAGYPTMPPNDPLYRFTIVELTPSYCNA